jgi:hypothetical protein
MYLTFKQGTATEKEGGSTISTQPIDCLQQTPNAQSDLIYFAYTDLQSSWHIDCPLTLVSAHYRSWTYNTRQHDRPHNTPAHASLIHTQMPVKDTFILLYRLCTLRKHKLSFYQMSQNSRPSNIVQSLFLFLSRILYSNNLTKLPGAAEKVRHSVKVT